MSDTNELLHHNRQSLIAKILGFCTCRPSASDAVSDEVDIPFNRRGVLFPFEEFRGTMKDATNEAISRSIPLFVFLYSEDNDDLMTMLSVFMDQEVRSEIERNYLFYPIEICSTNGWSYAQTIDFTCLPVISIIKGNPPHSCFKHDGLITPETLLSFIRMDTTSIIEEQNIAFMEAESQDRETREIEEKEEDLKKKQYTDLENEFNSLPHLDKSPNTVTIRFHMPDGANSTFIFNKQAPSHQLFVFIGYKLYPKQFVLLTGFPIFQICDNDRIISDICPDKNFTVHVDLV